MIPLFVINGADYSLFAIGGIGALTLFAIQLALCFKAKRTGVKLIPTYFVLLLVGLAGYCAISGSSGSVLDISGVVAIVVLCFALLFGISIGAAGLIHRLVLKRKMR